MIAHRNPHLSVSWAVIEGAPIGSERASSRLNHALDASDTIPPASPGGYSPLMPEATLRRRAGYAFDRTMSRGTGALVLLLAVASLVLVLVFSIFVLLLGDAPEDDTGSRPGFFRQLFNSLLHALDPGTVGNEAIGSGTVRWGFLLLMLAITIGGLFIVSALIGVLATGFEEKLGQLRRGRSFVLEQGHTLILGWSPSVFTILSELVVTGESERRRRCVVILANKDKLEIEEAISAKVKDLGRLRVVVRTGDATDLDDLAVVNPYEAGAILVVADEAADPDAQVIKTILALTGDPQRRAAPYHIVATIHDPDNLDAARLVGGDEAVLIDKRETIARLIVQSSRQSGASIVHTDLLDFAGDEIYLRDVPDRLLGGTYADALLAYENCTTIGLVQNREMKLNPPPETKIRSQDQLVAIAEDEARLRAAEPFTGALRTADISRAPRAVPHAEHVLLLGWNSRAPAIVNEMDGYVQPGSTLTVVADAVDAQRELAAHCAGVRNLEVRFHAARTDDRRTLASVSVANYDQVIVLCYSEQLDTQRADARTLVTLLHLRDLSRRSGRHLPVASEMLDDRNRALAQVTKVDDVIVSDRLISLLMCQISENPALHAVFDELFTAEGSEIYMRPATDYVRAGSRPNFATIIEAARGRAETAIGYRVHAYADDPDADYGVRLNIPKSQEMPVVEDDRVIVLALD